MHKFGKMDCHLHATVPVPMQLEVFHVNVTDDEYSVPTEMTALCIYKNITGLLCRKINSEPFLY